MAKKGDKAITPQIAYLDVKATIEAYPYPREGMEAITTDTHERGFYDGTNWIWGALALVTSAPVAAISGKYLALDTITNIFYVWNGSSWVAISGGGSPPTGTVTSFMLLEDGTSFLLLESGDKFENG